MLVKFFGFYCLGVLKLPVFLHNYLRSYSSTVKELNRPLDMTHHMPVGSPIGSCTSGSSLFCAMFEPGEQPVLQFVATQPCPCRSIFASAEIALRTVERERFCTVQTTLLSASNHVPLASSNALDNFSPAFYCYHHKCYKRV